MKTSELHCMYLMQKTVLYLNRDVCKRRSNIFGVPVTVLEDRELTPLPTDSAPPTEPPVRDAGALAEAPAPPCFRTHLFPFTDTWVGAREALAPPEVISTKPTVTWLVDWGHRMFQTSAATPLTPSAVAWVCCSPNDWEMPCEHRIL